MVQSREIYKRSLLKPDGRHLVLYGRRPISEKIVATNPKHGEIVGGSELRWHPLRGEWVAFASHRQDRTFLPPREYSPLAVTKSDEFPTELPAGEYDMAVFDNLFASLQLNASPVPEMIVPSRPGDGHCEVVVFTQNADTSLSRLPLDQVRLLLEVLVDRYEGIAQDSRIKYILPFENRGVEVGVTLHHPHGQIYSYPFIPPLQLQMLATQKQHFNELGSTLLSDLVKEELKDGRRIVHKGSSTVAFVPVCARYPYETWVVPERPVRSPGEMTPTELDDLSATLKTLLLKYDGLWERPFPYLMAFHAAPCNGEAHPEWHFHIEFYPPYRSRDRLKYLAGTELAAGMFVNDSLPEAKAKELRDIEVHLENQ